MELYLLIKLIHVVSATILFGTGLGIAVFMWQAHRGGDVQVIFSVSRNVVLADFSFTLPAVIIQLATGLVLAQMTGLNLTTSWILLALILYFVAGACWLPVIWLQLRVRDIAHVAAERDEALPARYYSHMRLWFLLGWPAFISVLLIFYLMVYKPSW